ncbi:MAG: phosphotransferase [Patescibacteria group bacterium]
MKESLKTIYLPEVLKEEKNRRETIGREQVNSKFLLEKMAGYVRAVNSESKIIGSGSRAEIKNDLLDFGEKGEAFGIACVKKNVFPYEFSHLQNNLEEEGYLQETARLILDNARNEKTELAEVPAVIAYIEDDENEAYLAMRAIKGKTLWRLAIEAALEANQKFNEKIQNFIKINNHKTIDGMLDLELENVLIELEGEKDLVKKIIAAAGKNPFLTSKQTDIIRNTINVWNENGFYHRDLHLKNIMLDKQGRIFIIDFGTALYDAQIDEDSAWEMGEDRTADKDISVVSVIKDLVKLNAEEQTEKEGGKLKKIITAEDSYLQRLNVELTAEGLAAVLSGKHSRFNADLDRLTNQKDYDKILSLLTVLLHHGKQLDIEAEEVKNFVSDYMGEKFNESRTKIHSEKIKLNTEKIGFKQRVFDRLFKGEQL